MKQKTRMLVAAIVTGSLFVLALAAEIVLSLTGVAKDIPFVMVG